MSELLPTRPAPLAWDREGHPFHVPPGAIGWHVKKLTGGRPRVVFDENHLPVLLDIGAHMGDLRSVVPGPGHYRLVPVDAEHNELSPIAHIEVMPEGELEPLSAPGLLEVNHRQDRMYELVERLITSRESHDVLAADLLKTLVTSTAAIQQSTAALLHTANTTIRVANGVEALERPEPQLDLEALSIQLSEILAARPAEKAETPWFMQLLSSPLGAPLAQLMSGFMNTLAAAQAPATSRTAAPAPTPATSATAPAPQSSPPAAAAPQPAEPNGAAYEEDVEPDEGADAENGAAEEAGEADEAGALCDAAAVEESQRAAEAGPEDMPASAVSPLPEAAMQGSERARQTARQEARQTQSAKPAASGGRKAMRKQSRKQRRKRR